MMKLQYEVILNNQGLSMCFNYLKCTLNVHLILKVYLSVLRNMVIKFNSI